MITRPITAEQVAVVHLYFRERGFDPCVIAPEFFLFWLREGFSPAQIYALATRTTYAVH